MPDDLRKRLELQLDNPELYVPLLEGPPVTRGMRSGRVRLDPGEEAGVHSTKAHEEIVIILEGTGTFSREGDDALEVSTGQAVYVPPHTVHNVTNESDAVLKYVYVVAPVAD